MTTSKYEPLKMHPKATATATTTLSFKEIERIIGATLTARSFGLPNLSNQRPLRFDRSKP